MDVAAEDTVISLVIALISMVLAVVAIAMAWSAKRAPDAVPLDNLKVPVLPAPGSDILAREASLSRYDLARCLYESIDPDTGLPFTLARIAAAVGRNESWVMKVLNERWWGRDLDRSGINGYSLKEWEEIVSEAEAFLISESTWSNPWPVLFTRPDLDLVTPLLRRGDRSSPPLYIADQVHDVLVNVNGCTPKEWEEIEGEAEAFLISESTWSNPWPALHTPLLRRGDR